jgi:dipeptidyl aminopeptidase/acylaminoacyl peptidase
MIRFVFCAVLLCGMSASRANAQVPPLIDRELFFGDPEISGAQISPDGKSISFIKPFMNVRNIWVKATSDPFDRATPLTADTTRPTTEYFWSRDSKYILYVQDKGGDENYRIYAVDPAAHGDPVPPARDLTPLANVRAQIIDVPRTSPNEIVVALNDRRADLHDVYRLNLSTGERSLVRKNDENIIGWLTDLGGMLRLGLRMTESGGSEILRLDSAGVKSIYSVSAEEECSPLRFTPDGKKFYMITNKGAIDKIELQLFDLATGKTTLVEKDPKNEVDFGSALFSEVTDELLATFYVGDRVRVYPREKKFAADYARLVKAVPPGEIGISSMTADEQVAMVVVSSDVDPGSRYLYNRATGKADLLYRSRPKLPMEHLAPMKPVRYKARDGMSIPAYLVTPKGVPARNLPTVMVIHGGPWVRDMWGYDPEAQFLANRGYAVLMPNFRGSTGYGKRFLNAGNKQWGTGSMQHDITDAVKDLVAKKIADPKRVAIYGGSYGGYATLAGLAFTPDLFAAGVSYVGPSNIITLLKSIPPYWAPAKKMFAVRVGDMENPKDLKQLERQSPLNSASKIKAPLLVVQGANDPRVKKAESDQIVVAMRDLGRQVEYMVAPDEGHGFAGKENRLAMYTAMEKFLAKHIGGRAQESVSPDIQKRLAALTVDVKTVTKAPEVSAAAAEFRAALVQPHTAEYTSTFDVRGQTMTMSTTRVVSSAKVQGTAVWRIVETSSGMMGSGVDTLEIDATTLASVRRSATQGPGTINLSFSNEGVKGSMSGGGMNVPIDVKSTYPLLSDGPGVDIPVCTLPLSEGYTATIHVFDLMGGKSQDMVVKVTGTETVKTPAGSFDAVVVQITSVDDSPGGMKLWITKKDPKVVKNEQQLSVQMGGGTVVTELAR